LYVSIWWVCRVYVSAEESLVEKRDMACEKSAGSHDLKGQNNQDERPLGAKRPPSTILYIYTCFMQNI
jgi:hypothetical protein